MSTFKGRVTHIGDVETFSENFSKQSVRLQEDTDRDYPQSIVVDFSNKMLEKSKELKEGDLIEVSLNFRTNESKKDAGKFFTSISAWKVDVIEKAGQDDSDLPFN